MKKVSKRQMFTECSMCHILGGRRKWEKGETEASPSNDAQDEEVHEEEEEKKDFLMETGH